MKLEDMILVSVDDHICEPDDLFTHHMPAQYKAQAPRVVSTAFGQAWEVEGKRVPGLGLNAVVGRPRVEYGMEPTGYDQLRPGTYDVHARIGDMNANGILGSLCFANFPGFSGGRFQKLADKNLGLAILRAYNDWHVHDWAGAYPGRFIPVAILPLWDMKLCIAELRRMIDLGVRAISFPDNPAGVAYVAGRSELPSIHDPYWEPLWALCNDSNVVICCHIGTGSSPPYASDLSPIASWIAALPMATANVAADWLFASFWSRYPNLRMALSEGGVGWIPYFLERADFTVRQHGAWTNLNLGGKMPSEIFRKHIIACFIEDDFGLQNRHAIGINNMTWECDYPHSDCTWPLSPESLWRGIQTLPDHEINQITHLNAMRDFSYTPFDIFKPEDCTVGALRAKAMAAGVDTAERSVPGGLRPRFEPGQPVTSGHVQKLMATV
jgi:predicted TIM-barrel fold metal-dependent hydrolase